MKLKNTLLAFPLQFPLLFVLVFGVRFLTDLNIWWSCESRNTKCFYSAQKMRKFVNELHSWYNDYIEIEKTWSYRDFTPRHKWFYISFEPNQFVCVEKY